MLALAEFGAKRHGERRQVEFRIFIAYVTLLTLALYHVIKFRELLVPFWIVVVAIVFLIWTYLLYFSWQKAIHIGLLNDVRRRDFYLKKAELISYYLSQKESPKDIKVKVNLGGEENMSIAEDWFFKQRGPLILSGGEKVLDSTVPPSWSDLLSKKCDPHFQFQIGFPILMLSLLICVLIWREPQALIPALMVTFIGALFWNGMLSIFKKP